MALPADPVPLHTGDIGISTKRTKVAVVRLYGIPAPDETYDTVLFQIVDPAHDEYEIRLSGGDAQRLGHALNAAGGGVLIGSCLLSREEVGLAIDALASQVQDREPNEFRPLLRKLQEAYKRDE